MRRWIARIDPPRRVALRSPIGKVASRLHWVVLALSYGCGSSAPPTIVDDAGATTRGDGSSFDAANDGAPPVTPELDASRDVGAEARTEGGGGGDVTHSDVLEAGAHDGGDTRDAGYIADAGSVADGVSADGGHVDAPRDGGGPVREGRFTAMTYNVAGLPAIISSSDPANNTPRIGMLVNGYDMVSVQEDFNYHAALYEADRHPYRTPTTGGVPFGSGLNVMSNFPFDEPLRVKWNACTEADCLTPKGFFLVRVAIAPGVLVDLYDLHANAGASEANMAARRENLAQLGEYIERVSAGNAVLVLGDTNTRYTRGEKDQIADFVDRLALRDVWVELARGGVRPVPPDALMDCDGHPAAGSCEVVDKILYRSSALVTLTATAFDVPDALFRTDAGTMLSDHRPVVATFDWRASADVMLSDAFGGTGGAPFQDHPAVAPTARVMRLAIQSGARVDRIELSLANGQTYGHGGSGGVLRTLDLDPLTEAISGARLCRGEKDGATRVVYASFHTDAGRTLSGGTESADCVDLRAPPGFQVSGLYGRAADEIDRLGLVYTRR